MSPIRACLLVFILSLAFNPAWAQYEQSDFARGLSMGGAGLALEDPQALLYNPAALPAEKTPTAFAAASEWYGKAGIRTVTAGLSSKLPLGLACGLAVAQSSNPGWRQSGLTAGLAKRAGIAGIGAQAWVDQTVYFEAARYTRVHFSVGGVAYPLPNLRLAAVVHNLGNPGLRYGLHEPSPVGMQAGLYYKASANTILTVQADKFGTNGVTLRGGLEHQVITVLALRIGASQEPGQHGQVHGGFGLTMRSLRLDYAMAYHPVLGARHSISLILAMPWLRRPKVNIQPECLPELLML